MRPDVIVCPNCSFCFSKSYARIRACGGCPMSVSSCAMIKCPKCANEFEV